MVSPGTSVPDAKKGIRTFLRSWEGLRPTDGVVVRGAPVDPTDLAPEQVTLGDVTAPQTFEGLAAKAETVTMTCWVQITRPGSGDDAEDAARDRAAELLALVQAALRADPSAGGAIPPPQRTTVGESALTEFPAELEGGVGARAAQYRFTVQWISHIT